MIKKIDYYLSFAVTYDDNKFPNYDANKAIQFIKDNPEYCVIDYDNVSSLIKSGSRICICLKERRSLTQLNKEVKDNQYFKFSHVNDHIDHEKNYWQYDTKDIKELIDFHIEGINPLFELDDLIHKHKDYKQYKPVLRKLLNENYVKNNGAASHFPTDKMLITGAIILPNNIIEEIFSHILNENQKNYLNSLKGIEKFDL